MAFYKFHLPKLFKTLISLLILSATSFPQQNWERFFGGEKEDYGNYVQQTSDGGFIIAGYSQSFGAGNADVYLIRTNSFGDTLWTRTYGGTDDDMGYCVQQTSDDGFIICGKTLSYGNGSQVYLIRTDPYGDILWIKNYGNSNNDFANEVKQTSDDGFIVIGSSMLPGSKVYNAYLLKVNSSGDTSWTKIIGSRLVQWYGTSILTAADGYIIAGVRPKLSTADANICLIKTNTIGDTLWTRTYNAGTNPKVQNTSDGGYIITGTTVGSTNDPILIKTDENGQPEWLRNYPYNYSFTYGKSVRQTSDGGYIVIGESMVPVDIYFIHLVKTNSAGDTLWHRTFAQGNGNSILQVGDGGYIIAGRAFVNGNSQVYLLKTDADGLTAVNNEAVINKNPGFELTQNYPNPFNPVTNFGFRIANFGFVSLKIYDSLGNEILTLVNEEKGPGTYKVKYDAGKLSSGIYFYSIRFVTKSGEQQSITKKMLMLK